MDQPAANEEGLRRPVLGSFFASRLGFRGRGVRRFAPERAAGVDEADLADMAGHSVETMRR